MLKFGGVARIQKRNTMNDDSKIPKIGRKLVCSSFLRGENQLPAKITFCNAMQNFGKSYFALY